MSHPASALVSACSPPQKKHRFDVSGYPSPPSSGRTERDVGDDSISDKAEGDKRKVDGITESAKTIEKHIECPPEVSHSLSPAKTCKEDDEQDEDEGENGDETIVPMCRSHSDSPWTDKSTSSPSTSIAAQSQIQYHHLQQSDDGMGSPYIDDELPLEPIRDTPRNPFLQGGPADVGFTGHNGHLKRMQQISIPRERGKMTYVFRGQRVTYADPYASDSDEDDGIGPSSRGSMIDRFQPKLLFPSAGKAAVRCKSSDVFGIVKKTRISSMKSKPPLDMTLEGQNGGIVKGNNHLLERLDRAGWSDDDVAQIHHQDEHDDEGDGGFQEEQEEVPRRCLIARQVEGDSSDDDNEDSDMEAEDDNPFLESSCSQTNISFLKRLQQTQATFPQSNTTSQTTRTSQITTTSGVIRPSHGAHRYNPYSQQPRGHAHGLAHAMHVPDHLKGRAR